eukprot:2526765-Prorocentrum_lima.AAC.1
MSSSSLRITRYCPQTTRTVTRPADIQCNCHERPKCGHWLWSACDVGAFPVTPNRLFENEAQ